MVPVCRDGYGTGRPLKACLCCATARRQGYENLASKF